MIWEIVHQGYDIVENLICMVNILIIYILKTEN